MWEGGVEEKQDVGYIDALNIHIKGNWTGVKNKTRWFLKIH